MIIQIPIYNTEIFPGSPKTMHGFTTQPTHKYVLYIFRHYMAIEFIGYSIHQSVEWFARS